MRLACLALALTPGLLAKCMVPGPSICDVARSEVVFLGRAVKANPRSEKHAIEIWRRESMRMSRGNFQGGYIQVSTPLLFLRSSLGPAGAAAVYRLIPRLPVSSIRLVHPKPRVRVV